MKHLLIYIYVSIVGLLCIYMAVLTIEARPKAELNCSVAEISPDFSYADKEKCRLIRSRKL
jgi:hypothetical protein